MTSSLLTRLDSLKSRFHRELHQNVLPFWLKYSLDHENGGYFNCLDQDGTVFDTTKHMWLQGRQVWMMSKLYNTLGDQKYLDAAKLGADFIRKHGRTADDRVYFSVTKEGKPVFMQRKIFSECFYVMALAEYARASGDQSARDEARSLLEKVFAYANDITLVGRPVFEGAPATISLAVPMILLNLILEVVDEGETTYKDREEWCILQMKKHIHSDKARVFETVGPNGEFIDTPEGRLLNPGHAIEAGWFLMAYAKKNQNEELQKLSLEMINWSLDHGWDQENGGILYFQDYKGFSPIQLEWNMKLWWPHCEALVALVMAFEETKDVQYLDRFESMTEYTFKHFSDPEHGEWFGYLDRENRMSQRFKGGPYKGCFHVPRALFLCHESLQRLYESHSAE